MTTPVTSGSASAPIDGSGVRACAVPASQDGQSGGTAPQEAPPLDRSSEKGTPEPASPGTHPADRRLLLPRSLVMLLGAGSAVLVLAGIRSVAWLVGPVFLALMIVIAIAPVQSALLRRGWPAWLSTLVLVLLVTGVLVVFGLVFVVSIARLAALLPQYADQADKTLQSVKSSLKGLGVNPDQLKQAVDSVNPAKLVALIGTVLAGLSGLAMSLVFLLCLMLFLSVEAGGVDQRLAAVAADRPQLETALRSFAAGTRSYLVVTAVFGLIVGVLDGGALWIIGVPLPVLWGVLSFLTNFIPNVGFVIGLVPPALLALLTGGVSEMLVVIAVYCVLNFVIQTVIQPRFVGDSVGLAMTTTFVALVFWAWLLGPIGALLAIPLTLLAKALLVDVDPTARWAIALAGSLERPPRPSRGHQRRKHETHAEAAAADAGIPAG
jgi:AI-2 transport protein TqsA